MRGWASVTLLCTALCALPGAMVRLRDHGYDDVILGIHPSVPENADLIENIKSMVTEASNYMFNATKKGVFFRRVKIVIPSTWRENSIYARPRTESFQEADVIVADPFLKYGDDPYTLQYRGCGEKAKYIHFTPNFILNDKLLSVFGPRGKVFLHEWAHLRWGVFDEYSIENPFYVSAEFKAQATGCSADITGATVFLHECRGSVCSIGTCSSEPQMGVINKDCKFLPDKSQNSTSSIMYMQALPSVVAFCDASTHNAQAPNLQNRMCNSQSTWEVIMQSPDFNTTSPGSTLLSPPEPTFTLLQSRERVICLVLDVSGSMNKNDRIHRQRQAAELFLLQIIETGSFAGIVTFSQSAHTNAPLRQIVNDSEREELTKLLPVGASGGTNICEGLRMGFQVIEAEIKSTEGAEMILLTDGEDPGIQACFTEVKDSGAIVHTIALGHSADDQLETLARMTGGLMFSATDNLTSTGLIDAFSGMSSGNGNYSQQSVQLESIGFILRGVDCRKAAVPLDGTVGRNTFFVVTWQTNLPLIQVYDPRGNEYPRSNFSIDATLKAARLQIPGIAKPGDWIYSLCNTESPIEIVTLTVTSHAVNDSVPPVTAKVHMSHDANTFPNPMVVYAEVSQGFTPVIGADVTAVIESQNGKPVILLLEDNGAGADIAKHDGIYSKYFTSFSGNGRYSLKVRVHGREKTARLALRKQGHALYLPGYVQNGNLQMNPPRPSVSDDDLQTKLGGFSRTASGSSFTVSAIPNDTPLDIFPPCKILDLEAQIENNRIELTWTAPGDDLDLGTAARYDMRMSGHLAELMNNFEDAPSVNIALTPKPSGSLEALTFRPEELGLQNGRLTYFAVRAVDKAGSWSEISNIAQAALLLATPTSTSPATSSKPPATEPASPTPITCIPPSTYATISAPPSPDLPLHENIHIPTVVVTVCLGVVIICLVFSITLCLKQD